MYRRKKPQINRLCKYLIILAAGILFVIFLPEPAVIAMLSSALIFICTVLIFKH